MTCPSPRPLPPPPAPPITSASARPFESSYSLVHRLLRRQGLDTSGADDSAQQAFLVLLQRMPEVERGTERAFLCSSAVRIARRLRVRSLRDRTPGLEPVDAAPPERGRSAGGAARRGARRASAPPERG